MVLVGLMAAGKTTVGALLAERLSWRFVDLDAEIERAAGTSIVRIFEEQGESEFRRLEAEVTAPLAGCDRTVVASGGGWAVQRGLWERLLADTLFVWLRVEPREALGRIAAAADDRPLLRAADPERRLRELLRDRESAYARAQLHVETAGRSADSVAADIEFAVRRPIVAPAATLSTN